MILHPISRGQPKKTAVRGRGATQDAWCLSKNEHFIPISYDLISEQRNPSTEAHELEKLKF